MTLATVILAAGKGTRMKSALPKVLHPIAGKPMVSHVVDAARALAPQSITLVYGHGGEHVREALKAQSLNWALQAEQLGTGHAVAQAMPFVSEDIVLILYGDVPLIRPETLREFVARASASTIALMTLNMDNPTGYGRIIRDADGRVQRIVEQKDANDAELVVDEGTQASHILVGLKSGTWTDAAGNPFHNDGSFFLALERFGYDVTDPLAYNFGAARSEIRLRPQGVTNTIKTAQFDAGYDFNPSLTLKAGVNYKEYEFDSWALARVNEGVVPQLPAGVTLASLTELVSGFGRNLDAPAGTVTSWIAPNLQAFADLFDIYSNTGLFELSGASNSNARGNIRSVTEKDSAAYLQLDFTTELAGVPIRGDVGVRYVKTEQSSTGYQLVAGAAQQTTVDRDYDDVLPALNVTAEVTPDFLVRFGAAKVMTRPNLGSVTPGGSLSTVGVFSVSSGNPYLDPIRATTYDLSAEWYFAPEALLSVGLFYKDIDSYIQTSRTSRPFNESGLPLELLNGLGVSPSDVFLFSQPVNTEGGPLKGIEVSYQQPFSFLPGPFDNLGAIFNVTLVDSKISYISSRSPTGFVENDLIGLSKTAYNATLYYEDDRFSARVSAAYRDRYLTAVPSGTSTNDIDGVRDIVTVDASASYALNDRIKLTFEGLNLTDAFNEQYTDSRRDSIYVYSHTGRQYNFGVRYSF